MSPLTKYILARALSLLHSSDIDYQQPVVFKNQPIGVTFDLQNTASVICLVEKIKENNAFNMFLPIGRKHYELFIQPFHAYWQVYWHLLIITVIAIKTSVREGF